ncbi:MAG: hypothetical protein R3F37_05155 [Candidatus Competibacteraceae bacterium]
MHSNNNLPVITKENEVILGGVSVSILVDANGDAWLTKDAILNILCKEEITDLEQVFHTFLKPE